MKSLISIHAEGNSLSLLCKLILKLVNDLDAKQFLSICKLKFARYFYFVKSICFPFGQTRYDMNSRRASDISSAKHISSHL